MIVLVADLSGECGRSLYRFQLDVQTVPMLPRF